MVPYGSTPTERSVMSRALGVLFGAGGLLVLITLLLPRAADADEAGVAAPALIALGVAGVLFLLDSRATVLTLQLFLVGGSVLITGVLFSGGAGSGLYPPLYILVSSYAFFFFRLRVALAQVAVSAGFYGAVLLTTSTSSLESGRWVMLTGTLTVGGVLIGRMVAAVRAQAADLAAVSQMAGGADVTKALRATCDGVLASLRADVAIMLRPAADGAGLTVEAMTGSAESGQVFAADGARLALERAYKTGQEMVMESDERPRGLRRFDGTVVGLAQPVLRDGEVVAVLAVAWTSPRRALPDRARPVALLYAAEASLSIQRAAQVARDRERQALEINDNIVQGLVVAKYSAQRGNVDGAIEAIDDTLVRARNLISDQLSDVVEGRGIKPGDLARAEAAGVRQQERAG